jgi:hypothetical protein
MQLRGLLLAVAALAVLGLGVFFSNKYKKEDDKKGSDTPKLLAIPEDQIAELEIKRRDGGVTALKKGEKWRITAPQALPADADAVTGMMSTVAGLSTDRLVEENAPDLNLFGLASPQVEVTVTKKDGKKTRLLIGDETFGGSAFYARLDGEKKVYTIGSWNKTSLDKTAQDLRDKRLVIFDSEKLTRVELSAKNQTIEFGKNPQNEWQIVKPKPLRADNWAVEEIVRKVKDAKMDTAVSDEDAKKATAAFASATRVALARVTDASGAHEIEIRKKDKDYYAKGSAVAGVHKVTTDLGEGLDKGLDDLRNKKLFDFGFNDPSKIEVKGSDGKSKNYEKSAEKWMLGSQQMDSVGIQSFVDKLRDLSSIKFLDSGFTAPVFEVKLTAKEGKLTDHVRIAKSGNSVFAIRVNEPSVYEIDGKAFEELTKAEADIKPPAAAKDEKKK